MPAAQANAIGVAAEPQQNQQRARPTPVSADDHGGDQEGQLSVRWGYSRNLHRETTIRHLARSFKKAFKSLIDCCETDDTTLFTPSDFPDANLSQLELDEFISSISAIG